MKNYKFCLDTISSRISSLRNEREEYMENARSCPIGEADEWLTEAYATSFAIDQLLALYGDIENAQRGE